MSGTKNWQKAQKAASSPEARAKAVATRKRRQEEALLAHAKMVTMEKQPFLAAAEHKGIPLEMIPDRPRKQQPKKGGPAKSSVSRQEVVLALLKYLNGE